MAEIKIIARQVDRKPCVCGGTLAVSQMTTHKRKARLWLCTRHCGARGLTYQGALRRKVRLDLLSWGDLRRNARTLTNSDEERQLLVAAERPEVQKESAVLC